MELSVSQILLNPIFNHRHMAAPTIVGIRAGPRQGDRRGARGAGGGDAAKGCEGKQRNIGAAAVGLTD